MIERPTCRCLWTHILLVRRRDNCCVRNENKLAKLIGYVQNDANLSRPIRWYNGSLRLKRRRATENIYILNSFHVQNHYILDGLRYVRNNSTQSKLSPFTSVSGMTLN